MIDQIDRLPSPSAIYVSNSALLLYSSIRLRDSSSTSYVCEYSYRSFSFDTFDGVDESGCLETGSGGERGTRSAGVSVSKPSL